MARSEPDWRFIDVDERAVERLVGTLDCNPAVARILVARELDEPDAAVAAYGPTLECCHDPGALPDVDPAVELLARAIDHGETITIYGDRDVDGIAGTALLLTLLKDLGATVGYHVPGKYDGHGLHEESIDRLADRDTDLLVTVDCGTDDRNVIAQAARRGMDVIVTDHHPPTGDLEVPFVNPVRSSAAYPNDALAAAGIALKLGEALLAARSADPDPFAAYAYPLAGVATVADNVTMTLENRAIVHAGYDRLRECPVPGLRKLTEQRDLASIRDLGWRLAPILNAAREATDGHLMIGTLFEEDPERIAARLEELRALRQERQDRRREWAATLKRLVAEQADPERDPILTVEADGYVGSGPLLDLSERTRRPVLCHYRRHDGTYRGMLVSAGEVDVRALVDAHAQRLLDRWGHAGAAGFIVDGVRIDGVVTGITTLFERRYDPADLAQRIDIDCVLELRDLAAVLAELEPLRPFGRGHPEPTVLVEAVEVAGIDRFGRDDRHVRLNLEEDAASLTDWNGTVLGGEQPPARTLDVAGSLGWDAVAERPQVSIEAVRAAKGVIAERS